MVYTRIISLCQAGTYIEYWDTTKILSEFNLSMIETQINGVFESRIEELEFVMKKIDDSMQSRLRIWLSEFNLSVGFGTKPMHTLVASMQCFLIDEWCIFPGVDQPLHCFGVLWIMVMRYFNHAWSLTLQLKVIACGCPLRSFLIGLENYSC